MTKLIDKVWNFSKKNKFIHAELFSKDNDVELTETINAICHLWNSFDKPRVIDNLVYFQTPNMKMFVEVCNGKFDRGNSIPEEEFHDYYLSNKGKKDQHCSVHTHDKKWVKGVNDTGAVSGVTGGYVGLYALWMELDRKNPDGSSDLFEAIQDSNEIRHQFKDPSDCKVWWSGNNSTHISINPHLFGNPLISYGNVGKWGVVSELAHLLARGVRYDGVINNVNRLSNDEIESLFSLYYPNYKELDPQMMSQVMESIDSNIYSINSLIRLPYSVHEKGGGDKCLVDEDGGFIESSNKLDFEEKEPYLLEEWIKAYNNMGRPEFTKIHIKKEPTNKIERVYLDLIPEFNLEDADSSGWVGPFFNPFYPDTNPSAYVSVKTGYLKDHGSDRHSLSFNKVTELWKLEKKKHIQV